ncbi:MAG: hypothetical protein HFF17_15755 [Oscillospiraceae bacterium]|nr:hypothetical protein [Oscillospiraceae bacterium]
MTCYEICYERFGSSRTEWTTDKKEAKKMVHSLRLSGYVVDVFAHTKRGRHKAYL